MNTYRENPALRSGADLGVMDSGIGEAVESSGGSAQDDGYRGIRITILVYFLLLIFEGSLRKWVFPGSANILLLIRDPVVIFCYLLAIRNGKFPTGPFVMVALFLGIVSFVVSLFTNPSGSIQRVLLIGGFGFHANFLHVPMIFLIRDAFDRERLRIIGKWTLLLAPLAAVLVFLQYRSAPDAFVNRGAGKDSGQIWSGVSGSEKIRPAGFFSYNTGNAAYLALVTAFLLNAMVVRKGLSKQMTIIAAASLAIAGSLSISRTCVLSIALVFGGAVISMLVAPKLASRSVLIAFMVGVLYFVAAQFSVIGEAVGLLQTRVAESGGLREGGLTRFLEGFIEPFRVVERAGFLGSGLGMGTNAAGGLLTGERAFMLGENEWGRHFLESGVLLGGAYIIWRLVLFMHLLRVSLAALKDLNPLPMLLFAACFMLVLSGPVGIPMTLGFVIVGAGMTLAAAKEPQSTGLGEALLADLPQQNPMARGRSAYAERLHSGRSV